MGITNLVGRRALLNFITGRYHAPVEENRFVLFVDIAGSTGLAERLGGVGIHRFLDRTFRLLTVAVVDYRGEVLNYVGDEVIVTWPERGGAIDGRPLRCFMAMRDALSRAASQFEREFGASPRIRGSLHFGSVIVGEIGDIKRAIVFNGDVMNTAARLKNSAGVWKVALSRRARRWRGSIPRRHLRFVTSGNSRYADAPMASMLVGLDAPAHLSPQGRGRCASSDARRVRGRIRESKRVERPLTRSLRCAPASTSPLRGEVTGAAST